MKISNALIVELNGHLARDVSYQLDLWEKSFLKKNEDGAGDAPASSSGLIPFFMLFVRFFAFFYQILIMMRLFLGVQESVALRFFKDHIELDVETTWLWYIPRQPRHEKILWQRVSDIHGKEKSLLFFFKRSYLFISHGRGESSVIDLGSMPESDFVQLVDRLRGLSSSPAVRQQVATAPRRFHSTGLWGPAWALLGVLLVVGGGIGLLRHGVPFFGGGGSTESTESTEPAQDAQKVDAEGPSGSEQPQQGMMGLSDLERELEAEAAILVQLEAKYRELIRLEPDNIRAMISLGRLAERYVDLAERAGAGQLWRKVERYLREAERLNPDLPSIAAMRKRMRPLSELAADQPITPSASKSPQPTQPSQGAKKTTQESAMRNKASEVEKGREKSALPPQQPEEESPARPMEKKSGVLVDNRDGTVTDRRTGLIGLKGACGVQDSWNRAIEVVGRLAHGQCGLTDGSVAGAWRLPTKEELPRLAQWEKMEPFAVEQGRSYWSSTSHEMDGEFAWFLDMGSNQMDYHYKSKGRHAIWPVRGQSRCLDPSAVCPP